MLMTKERSPAIRTLRGWATLVLLEAHATRECEQHSGMRDRADPPPGVPPDQAVAEISASR